MTADRRARGRPRLPLDRIVETALAILDEQGADALSMRTLATRLDSGTATLYRRFHGRDELIAHVVDAVMGEVSKDLDRLRDVPWRQAVETTARDMFEVLRRHPHVAPLIVARIPVGPNALALRERALAKLLESGFPPALAVRAWATLARYVLGFGSQLMGSDDAAAPPPDAWTKVDVGAFPATVATAGHIPIALADEFSFGLSMLLNGLAHHLDSEQASGSE